MLVSHIFTLRSYNQLYLDGLEEPNQEDIKVEKTLVYSVGRNDNGQLGIENTAHSFVPKLISTLNSVVIIKAACGLHHSVFLTNDGKVYSTGFNENGQLGIGNNLQKNKPVLIKSLEEEKVVDIACGYYHTLAKLENGDVCSFGRNDKGQWGINEEGSSSIKTPMVIKEFDIPNSLQSIFGNASDNFNTSR